MRQGDILFAGLAAKHDSQEACASYGGMGGDAHVAHKAC